MELQSLESLDPQASRLKSDLCAFWAMRSSHCLVVIALQYVTQGLVLVAFPGNIILPQSEVAQLKLSPHDARLKLSLLQ